MSDQAKPENANPSAQPGQMSVKFLFEKSPFYRTIHADGAWGRLDPTASIHMTLFNEKPQMVQAGVIQNTPDGRWALDETKSQFAHDAPLVREVEADVVMNVAAAVAVRDMLNNFINTALQHMQNAQELAKQQERQAK